MKIFYKILDRILLPKAHREAVKFFDEIEKWKKMGRKGKRPVSFFFKENPHLMHRMGEPHL